MIDNSGWEYIYKIWDNGDVVATNVLYVPSLSPEKDKMCMHFDLHAEYYMPGSCVPRTEEMMEFYFQRELKHISIMQGQPFCPKIYDVDEKSRKILIEFNKESLNKPAFTEGRSLDEINPNWEEELFDVIKSIYDLGYYKVGLYPHCFFYTDDLQLKTIDYYTLIDRSNPLISREIVEPIIGVDSQQRYIDVDRGEYYDFEQFFKNTLKNWVKWPGNPAPKFYSRLFND